jgi:glycosyltransferase involved in cell wall biosynthesis
MHGYRDKYQNKFGLQVKSGMFFDPYYWVTRYVCRQFDGVIFISECLRRFYQKAGLPVKKNRIIYHGYTASVKTPVVTEQVETRNHTSPRIGLPGRLIRMKGHRFAIDAVKQLVQNYPGIQLHVFGVGPEEEAIRLHITETGMEKHVIFHGFVNNLDERLREMDVILIPSMGESFGMVFLESFAAGVPVVAFDLPAGNEIIKDGYSGYLAKPGSVDGLVEKLKLILENPEQKNKIVAQAYAELNQVFSLDRMTTDYLAFYQEMLNQHN